MLVYGRIELGQEQQGEGLAAVCARYLVRSLAGRAVPASEKQMIYLQALLVKHGRRPLTVEEMARLTLASASRLIKEFTGK